MAPLPTKLRSAPLTMPPASNAANFSRNSVNSFVSDERARRDSSVSLRGAFGSRFLFDLGVLYFYIFKRKTILIFLMGGDS